MSSTNRGAERNRDDFYETPRWVTEAIVPELVRPGEIDENFTVLDPSCGNGAILDVFKALGATTLGIEIDPDRAAEAVRRGHRVACADALTVAWPPAALKIQNPPFCLAQEFVDRCLAVGGTTSALLRLAFLESAERACFHEANPSDVNVLANRPSFCMVVACGAKEPCSWRATLPAHSERPRKCGGCGAAAKITTSDSCAYAWFVWGPFRSGRIKVLGANDPERKTRVKRAEPMAHKGGGT